MAANIAMTTMILERAGNDIYKIANACTHGYDSNPATWTSICYGSFLYTISHVVNYILKEYLRGKI